MYRKNLQGARNLFFVVLGIDIGINVLAAAIIGLLISGTVQDLANGRPNITRPLFGTMEFWEDFFSVAPVLTTIGVGFALIRWLNVCYDFATQSIGATGFKNEGWTFAAWIIPIINLYKPYQIIDEIYKAGKPAYRMPDAWKKENGSSMLLIWWIFWVISHMVMFVMKRTPTDGVLVIEIYYIISPIVAALWFWVAGMLTRQLLDRAPFWTSQRTLASMEKQGLGLHSDFVQEAKVPDQRIAEHLHKSKDANQPPRTNHKVDLQAYSERNNIFNSDADDVFYRIAGTELQSGAPDPGLWARALADADASEQKVKAAYVRLRVARLRNEKEKRIREQSAIEAARKTKQRD